MQPERERRVMSSPLSTPIEDTELNPWTLIADEPPDSPLYLANGYMSTSLDPTGGFLPGSASPPCFVRGVYSDAGPGGVDRLALVPSWSRIEYDAPCVLQDYQRVLDLRTATVRTRFTLEEQRGGVSVDQVMFISRADQHQAVIRLVLTPDFDGPITLRAGLEATSDVQTEQVKADRRSIWHRGRSRKYGVEIAECMRFVERDWEIDVSLLESAAHAHMMCEAKAGQPVTLTQLVRIATSHEADDPLLIAQQDAMSYDDLLAAHQHAWDQLWQTDIEIQGDPDVQQFARAALFYLWSSVHEGDCWSIAPMGLSSTFYYGHIFWDAELWMYPSLLVTQPELARACVAYRERTMQPARDRAASNGYRGTQYPWEGGFTGEEMTPTWAATRDFQLHITADVAIGQWWYYLNTRDVDWLRLHGYPVIRECAEYWASRVEHDRPCDRYVISDVVCADEYAEHVNNDAFTNAAVRKALLIAVRAAELLGEECPREWREIADKMYIPFDSDAMRHLEYDGFDGRRTKQADVELLAYPLEHVTDREQIRRDLDYYATVIDPNGPAMSFSVYSVVSAQLGRTQQAYDYLRRAYVPNTRQPFFAFSETPENDEYFFCTGAGGALQALLYGFTGLRLREGYFVLAPRLAPNWTGLRLRSLFILGARTDIEITPAETILRRYVNGTTVLLRLKAPSNGQRAIEIGWDDDQECQILVNTEQGSNPDTVIHDARSEAQARFQVPASEPIRIAVTEAGGTSLLDVLIPG